VKWFRREPIPAAELLAELASRPAEPSPLQERVDAVQVRLVAYLDQQAGQWLEDRNVEARDLALDIALLLGLRLPSSGDQPAVPVIPGRSS
jgi:hypothetical protein